MTTVPDPLADEERRLKIVRFLVDLTLARLQQDEDLSHLDALALVERTRDVILTLFPNKERAYEMIYRPRFERVLGTRWPLELPAEMGSRFRI
ncbi:MAG TPA: hypothetical protein VIC59_12545 [Gemmatimonadota bacterium]